MHFTCLPNDVFMILSSLHVLFSWILEQYYVLVALHEKSVDALCSPSENYSVGSQTHLQHNSFAVE